MEGTTSGFVAKNEIKRGREEALVARATRGSENEIALGPRESPPQGNPVASAVRSHRENKAVPRRTLAVARLGTSSAGHKPLHSPITP